MSKSPAASLLLMANTKTIAACVYLLIYSTLSAYGAVILDGPSNLTVRTGEWGNFSCSVACTHAIDWFVEGYSHDIADLCTETRDGMMVCRERVTDVQNCNSESGYTEMLYILASEAVQLQRIAVQCGATSRSLPTADDCPPYLSYSRYAFLDVRAADRAADTPTPPMAATTPTTPTTLASYPATTPTPSPTLCPSPTIETTTQVVTVTVTVTATPTVTVVVQPPIQNSASHQRSGFGITAELLTRFATILASVLFI